jgi:hypothetical protein
MLVAAAVYPAYAQSRETAAMIKPFLEAFEDCVIGHATRLATSPDATELIVREAVAACAAEKNAIAELLWRKGFDTSTKLIAMLDIVDRQVTQAANMAVLSARKRK